MGFVTGSETTDNWSELKTLKSRVSELEQEVKKWKLKCCDNEDNEIKLEQEMERLSKVCQKIIERPDVIKHGALSRGVWKSYQELMSEIKIIIKGE